MNLSKFVKSFRYALEGLRLAVNVDQNVRIHIIIGCVVILLSIAFQVSRTEFLIILLAIFFVLITEFINTAIEEMTNLIVKEHRQEAKIAKDVAAASVLLSAIFAFIVGIYILFPKILILF